MRAVGSNIGDAPMLPELLNQIPSDQGIGSVTADGAYDTCKCHEAIAARDAFSAGRHRVRRLMGIMGLQAIYKRPNTSKKHPERRIYLYLLRKLPITRLN